MRKLTRKYYLTYDTHWNEWHLGDKLGWINWFKSIPDALEWVRWKETYRR